eukprot:3179071-Ditylum_brightwellii.AAC.1
MVVEEVVMYNPSYSGGGMKRATYFSTGAIAAIDAIVYRGEIAATSSTQEATIPVQGGVGGTIGSGSYRGWPSK